MLHLEWRPGHLAYLFYAGNIAYNLDPSIAQIKPAVELVHFWSLAVEEQFYLIWPLLILLISKRKTLVRTCLGLSAAGLVARCVLVHWSLLRGGEWAYAELPTHMDGLLAGALAAIWFRAAPLESILARVRWILPTAVAALAIIIAMGRTANFLSAEMTILGYPVLGVLFGCVLLLALEPGSLANRFGSNRTLRFFGKYSYGMYVFHYVFGPSIERFLPELQRLLHSVVLGGVAFVSLVMAGTIVLSVLSYNLYERQWLRLKSKFSYSTSN